MKLVPALLALVACACGAPRQVRAPAELTLAQASAEFGDLAQAERELVPLFADEVPGARRGEVFWAGWFLAQAHARLAFEPARDVGLGGGAARAAHAQAAFDYARRARLALDAAPDLPPPGLEFAGNSMDAALGLDLLELALEGALGFQERVARRVGAQAELDRPGGPQRLTQAARLDGRTALRVDLALFEHWAQSDPARAFECAARALEAGDRSAGWLGEREEARLEAWIRGGAGRPFRCPECRQPAVPELRACPNDQTPLAQFLLEPDLDGPRQGTARRPRPSISPLDSAQGGTLQTPAIPSE